MSSNTPKATTAIPQRVRFEEVTPAHEYAAFFNVSIESLVAPLNLPIFSGYDDLDELQLAFLTLSSGQTVTLGEYLNSPQPGTSLYVDADMQDISQIIIESCQQLQISAPEVLWLHPDFSGEINYAEPQGVPRQQPSAPYNKQQEPIDCFNYALQLYPRHQVPQYWAMLQHNLGLAYFNRNQGDRQENLQKSIECFNKSLEVYTQAEFPAKWQINQDDLTAAQQSLQEINVGDSPYRPINSTTSSALLQETLGAFIIAIARQVPPIPTGLQAKLHAIGQQIQANAHILEQPINLIRPLLVTYPTLQLAYDQARVELEQQNSHRSKGGSIALIKSATTAEITNSFTVICVADDSFAAAKKAVTPSTNLLQKIQQLWQKTLP
jgi:tetratricopeptide (TPR) repeat protein